MLVIDGVIRLPRCCAPRNHRCCVDTTPSKFYTKLHIVWCTWNDRGVCALSFRYCIDYSGCCQSATPSVTFRVNGLVCDHNFGGAAAVAVAVFMMRPVVAVAVAAFYSFAVFVEVSCVAED